MKLNYTSLQHAVAPVEERARCGLPLRAPGRGARAARPARGRRVGVRAGRARARLGYVQTEGGALPGGHSRTVRELRERGLLAGHLTAGAAFGGEGEAITTAGALHHGLRALGWDAAVCGPGPGIVGSGSALGHGGMAALDSAHAALALGCPTLLVARMSSGDERARHRGISHHTLTVLDLLLEPVTVALPAGMRSPVGADLRARPRRGVRRRDAAPDASGARRSTSQRPVRITRHDWRRAAVDLPAYAALRACRRSTMGRDARPRTRCSSARRSPAGRRSPSSRAPLRPSALRDEQRSAYERAARLRAARRRDRLQRADRRRARSSASATPTARRSRARSCATGARSAIVAHDERDVWLVRQPREAVGEPALLEIPAGRLDVEGEQPLQAAQRELAEEIGRGARAAGSRSSRYYTSAGFTDERVHLFEATRPVRGAAPTAARTSASRSCRWPLERLDEAIAECRDAKTLIGLLWLARRLNA